MKCLYCQKRVLAFRLLGGGDIFCSEEHQDLYRKQVAESAIERILKMEAKPKPKLEPKKPVKVEQPLVVEEEERAPEMAGFRMSVLEPMDCPALALMPLELQPAIVEAPEIRLTPVSLPGATTWYWMEPEWAAEGSFGDESLTEDSVTEVVMRELSLPSFEDGPVMVKFTAPPAVPVSFTFAWEPQADSDLPLSVATGPIVPGVQAESSKTDQWTADGWSPEHLPIWGAASGGESPLVAVASSLAVSTPFLSDEAFVSRWDASQSLPIWRSSLEGGQRILEIQTSRLGKLCWPSALDERCGQPALGLARNLFGAVSGQAAETGVGDSVGFTLRFPCAEPAVEPHRAAALVLPWEASRPVPHSRGKSPEAGAEILSWTAWPEVADMQGRLDPGTFFPETLAAISSADAVDRAELALVENGFSAVPEVMAPVLQVTAVAGFAPMDFARATLARTTHPKADIRKPASDVVYRLEQESGPRPASMPGGGKGSGIVPLAPSLQAPVAEPVRPELSSRDRVLRGLGLTASSSFAQTIVSGRAGLSARTTFHKGWTAFPAAPEHAEAVGSLPVAPAERFPAGGTVFVKEFTKKPEEAPYRVAALDARQLSHEPVSPVSEVLTPADVVRQPLMFGPTALASGASANLPAVGLAAMQQVASIWGELNDSRTFDLSANRRETAPRLIARELPCRSEMTVLAPGLGLAVRPVMRGELRVVDEQPVTIAPVPVELARALCPPVLAGTIGVRPRAQAGERLGWPARTWTPEPAARKRQFPASRPKMNRPNPVAPAEPVTLNGAAADPAFAAASLWTALRQEQTALVNSLR